MAQSASRQSAQSDGPTASAGVRPLRAHPERDTTAPTGPEPEGAGGLSPDRPPSGGSGRLALAVLAVVALAGCGVGGLALATQPQTSGLRSRVSSLTAQLRTTRAELAQVQAALAAGTSRQDVLQTTVTGLSHRVAGVQGSVRRLDRGLTTVRTNTNALTACVPQLQHEIEGLSLQSTVTGGVVTSVLLSNPTAIPASCSRTLYGP